MRLGHIVLFWSCSAARQLATANVKNVQSNEDRQNCYKVVPHTPQTSCDVASES